MNPRQIGGRRILEHEHGPQEDGAPDEPGVKRHGGGHEVGAVRLPKEYQPLGIKPVALQRAIKEGGEGVGLVADILLVEAARRQAPEPARKALLGGTAAQAEKRGIRRDPVRERHQGRLVAAASVEKHEGVLARCLGHMEPVHEGQIPARHARLARK